MNELVFWFIIIYGGERVAETFWKRKKLHGKVVAPYTLHLLILAHSTIFLIALYEFAQMQLQTNLGLQVMLGVLLVGLATVVRNWSIATLGPYHSIHIELREEQRLITSGPYRYLRNPYYISNAVELIGFPIVAHAKFALLISLSLYIPALLIRVFLEEKALKAKFGAPYCHYSSQVPRILPRLF